MEDIIYRMYKDGKLIHEACCPALFFSSVIPLRDNNLYDYIELEYNGKKIIHRKERILNEWKH